MRQKIFEIGYKNRIVISNTIMQLQCIFNMESLILKYQTIIIIALP